MDTILDRFLTYFEDYRVLFGAEPFCWPDQSLAIEYPVVEFGKRERIIGVCSGILILVCSCGYAKEIYQMITLKEVADGDDDQLYYTMVYLDEKLRVLYGVVPPLGSTPNTQFANSARFDPSNI
ncbi:hypothetical protein COOONC_00238 [Cooperia oncophora]